MTPKVGDKFKITKSNFCGDDLIEGGIVTFVRNGPGHGLGNFRAATGLDLTFAYEGNKHYPCRVVPVEPSPKDPIEYLKTAHADGDMIDPATMLRECFGITRIERVVTEWSEVKREIKVGDKVRITGDSIIDWKGLYKIGDIHSVSEIDERGYRLNLTEGLFIWFPASSVELI
mgnify:CR=1 FL=1